jgi:long-chain acyl-CoA synthetase
MCCHKWVMKLKKTPWDFLEQYRGRAFQGEWPTIPQMFEITCERFGERRAFTAFEPEALALSWDQAREAVHRTAGWLRAHGVHRGDRVALTGKNSPEWAVAYLGILLADAVVVPLDHQLGVQEMKSLIRFVEAPALFADEEKLEALADSGVALRISLAPGRPNYVLQLPESGEPSGAQAAETDTAAILFTSGTTGTPKGVCLNHRNLVADCYLSQANLNVQPTDVFYALMPIHHSYTMTAVFLICVSCGAEVVFGQKMVSKQILEDLKRGRVTMFLGVPMLFNRLLIGIRKGIREKGVAAFALIRALMLASGLIKKLFHANPGKQMFGFLLKKASLENIRICISGGGPLPSSTFRQFNQLGIDFVQGYGLTETSPIVALNPVEHYKEASVGKVIPRVEMRIREPDAEGRGEILIRGPVVMQGYYRNEAATREVLSEDGWLSTGDVGYLDRENYLFLTGRKKSMIVTEGGKNVYPEEIEDRFQLHGEIEQILVRGYLIDKKMKSEGIEAVVYPSPEQLRETGTDPQDAEAVRRRIQAVIHEVNAWLRPYQRIQRLSIVDQPMEMTTTRKIKRFKVAAAT